MEQGLEQEEYDSKNRKKTNVIVQEVLTHGSKAPAQEHCEGLPLVDHQGANVRAQSHY